MYHFKYFKISSFGSDRTVVAIARRGSRYRQITWGMQIASQLLPIGTFVPQRSVAGRREWTVDLWIRLSETGYNAWMKNNCIVALTTVKRTMNRTQSTMATTRMVSRSLCETMRIIPAMRDARTRAREPQSSKIPHPVMSIYV